MLQNDLGIVSLTPSTIPYSRFKMAAKQVSGFLRTYIAAGKASPSPPLGPSLGQVGSSRILGHIKCTRLVGSPLKDILQRNKMV